VSHTQEARSGVDMNHYSYRVVWSSEDGDDVTTAREWGPALSWLDEDPTAALAGLRDLVRESIADLTADGKPVPAPLADRDYLGRFHLTSWPQLHHQERHRQHATHAAQLAERTHGGTSRRHTDPLGIGARARNGPRLRRQADVPEGFDRLRCGRAWK
jgi:hypothetical protein